MRTITKRTIAVFLSVLMIVTSIPFIASADAQTDALKGAITAYETKMDGTVYTNMQAAFDAYAKAKEDLYAYEVGGKTDLDLAGDADTLNTATAAMTAWTSPKGTATASFPADTNSDTDASYDGYAENLLYFGEMSKVEGGTDVKPGEKYAGAAAISTHEYANENTSTGGKHRMTVAMYYPVAVMLYDGATTPVMPVMAMAHITESNGGSEVVRYVYGLYPAKDASGTNTASTTFTMKNQFWNFDNAKNDYMSNNWRYTMAQNNKLVATKPSDIRQSTAMLMSNYKGIGLFGANWWTYYPAALANAMQYSGGDSVFAANDNHYLFSENVNWRRHTGAALDTEYGTPSDYMTFTAKLSYPTMVVNYKALIDAAKSAATTVSAAPETYLINKSDVSATFAAVDDATAYNPNDDFANDNAPTVNAEACAANIKAYVDAINAKALTQRYFAAYDAISNSIAESKAAYSTHNSDNKYTDESYATFVAAYDAAIAEAKKVATNGFDGNLTVSVGNALHAAFIGLNVKPFDTGSSGNTDYDYDETTGTLVITPKENTDGKMEDYAKADDSPFGNNQDVTEVVIDPNVTYIGAHTFDGATNLETITVPAGATYGEGAFDNCPNLKTVIITGGEVTNESATNAPWNLPSVTVIKLGTDAADTSVTGIGDQVFTGKESTAYYVYNPDMTVPSEHNNTFGTTPTIHAPNPSTAKTYCETYPEPTTSFVQTNHSEHTWTLRQTVEVTCEKEGYKLYVCSICGAEEKRDTVKPLGHKWDDGKVTCPASCTNPGTIVYTCQNDENHKRVESIDATGHEWEVTSSTASCTTAGEITETCKNCHLTRTTTVTTPLGHNYVPTVYAPNCTELGYTLYVCSRCGDNYKSDYIAPNGEHEWDDGKVTREATVEETGIITYTCKHNPSHTKTQTIAKLTKAPVPSATEAQKAPVNKSIKKITGITTVSGSKKKIMTVSWNKVSGAQNYYVAFRKAGDKMWNYYWTGGKAKYVFKNLKTNGLYEFKFAAFKKINGKWQRGDWSKTSYRYYKKATLKKLTTKNKSIKVTWQRDKNCNYYVIFYATKKDMSNQKKITVKGNKKTSYTIKKLKKGKKYYVRVRAYKTKNKKNYAGELSSKKNIKVK